MNKEDLNNFPTLFLQKKKFKMKANIILTLIILIFFSGNLFSQDKNETVEGKVTRVDFSDTKVTINYELPAGDFPNIPYNVSLNIKTGEEDINVLVGLSGDYGKTVRPSNNLSLTWNFTEEGFVKSDFKDSEINIKGNRKVPKVNVSSQPIAANFGKKKKVKLPSVVVPSSVIAVGAGIFSFGISQELSAQDDYDFYKENRNFENENPGTLILEEKIAMSDQYLEDAKSKRKTGVSSMVVGSLVAVGGVYLLMRKMKARTEAKKRLSFQPDVQFQNNISTSVGMKLAFRF